MPDKICEHVNELPSDCRCARARQDQGNKIAADETVEGEEKDDSGYAGKD
jgi:hypothetical protein